MESESDKAESAMDKAVSIEAHIIVILRVCRLAGLPGAEPLPGTAGSLVAHLTYGLRPCSWSWEGGSLAQETPLGAGCVTVLSKR